MNCQQAEHVASLISAVLITLNIVALVSFYGWRRTRAPWRSVLFAVFALSALLVLDFFVYAIVPAPASAVQTTPKCP
jgi:hypothetical protein